MPMRLASDLAEDGGTPVTACRSIPRAAAGSQNEIGRRKRGPDLAVELYPELGRTVGVGAALDDGGGAGGEPGQLAGRGAQGAVAQPVEGLVAGVRAVGI